MHGVNTQKNININNLPHRIQMYGTKRWENLLYQVIDYPNTLEVSYFIFAYAKMKFSTLGYKWVMANGSMTHDNFWQEK